MLPDEKEAGRLSTAESECDSGLQTPRHMLEYPVESSLRLSVEPPTPDVDTGPLVGQTIATKKRTSRLQNMSRTLRSRKGRWIERASYDGTPQQAENFQALSFDSRGDKRKSNPLFSHMRTPQARLATERELDDDDEDAQEIVSKRDEDQVTANKSLLFQAWLWFQFAIVVVIFIFAMARKGPGVVLGGGERVGKERRAVARR
jgi:hypothetical protein